MKKKLYRNSITFHIPLSTVDPNEHNHFLTANFTWQALNAPCQASHNGL